jgi:hypothetical protein
MSDTKAFKDNMGKISNLEPGAKYKIHDNPEKFPAFAKQFGRQCSSTWRLLGSIDFLV